MNIRNKGNVFTNKQIEKFLKLFDEDFRNLTFVFYESRIDLLKYFMVNIFIIEALLGKLEGTYSVISNRINVFIFAQTDDGEDIQSKQLYSFHALTHEIRHYIQAREGFTGNKEKDADEFATKFIKRKSKQISKIMKWKDEWEVKEED
jgi:hypothetical protein